MSPRRQGPRRCQPMAATVQTSLRATDSLTRWGGEEFIILTPNAPLRSATLMAERLREVIAATAIRLPRGPCDRTGVGPMHAAMR
ncbi:MAG: diguanylate cyclase [Gammaproteobacteria bacterium]|nr:diguanylate cyclase [Gammaproteobacteria bacterium]